MLVGCVETESGRRECERAATALASLLLVLGLQVGREGLELGLDPGLLHQQVRPKVLLQGQHHLMIGTPTRAAQPIVSLLESEERRAKAKRGRGVRRG